MSAKGPEDYAAKPNPRNGRTRLISANWKMNLNHLEAIAAVQKLFYLLRPADYRYAEISLHPPFTDLRSLQLLIETDRMPLVLGAQNTYPESSGAFTGEVSPSMLSRLNVKYVIVGHSERRELFGESDAFIARKVRAVLDASMLPILCVGEGEEERQAGRTGEVLSDQVERALVSVKAEELGKVVVAYEPKWAIGTGNSATATDAADAASVIRATLTERFRAEVANEVRVQYGGSVNAGNARAFLELPELDGLLVGGASLDPEAFARVIQA